MKDDLRELVEDQFPHLAFDIVNAGPRWMYNYRDFKNRANWAHDEHNNYARMEAEGGRLRYAGPDEIDGTPAYLYRGLDRTAPDDHLNQWWYVAFYNVRLIDIESVDPQPVQVLNPNAVKLISVAKERNNGPGFLSYDIQVKNTKDKSTEKSFGATATTEFETSMEAKVSAGVGVAEGERSMSARFLARLEARVDSAWRESDSLEDFVGKKFRIFPYHDYELTVKEGTPHLRQEIPTYGRLECSVRIDIRSANSQDFASLDDLIQVWRGLRSGSEMYSAFFGGGHGVSDGDIAKWHRPKLNLNISVEGDRVRYSDKDTYHRPIPGMEEKAAPYIKADQEAVASGSR